MTATVEQLEADWLRIPSWLASPDPTPAVQALARAALRFADVRDPIPGSKVDALARALLRELPGFLVACGVPVEALDMRDIERAVPVVGRLVAGEASHPYWAARLRTRLPSVAHLARLDTTGRLDLPGDDTDTTLRWNAAAAAQLVLVGEQGEVTATKLLEAAAAEWTAYREATPSAQAALPGADEDAHRTNIEAAVRRWLPGEDGTIPILVTYGAVLWIDRIERAESRQICLDLPTYESTGRLWGSRPHEAGLVARDGALVAVPQLDGPLVEELARQGSALASSVGMRLFYELVVRGGRQYLVDSRWPLVLPGGVELAHQLGFTSGGAAVAVLDALRAGQALRIQRQDGTEVGGLWSYEISAAAPGRKASITVRLADRLLPRHTYDGEHIVALLPPVPGGRRNDATGRVLIHWGVLRELSRDPRGAVSRGVPLDFDALAAHTRSGLGRDAVAALVEDYLDPATGYLVAVPGTPQRYRLSTRDDPTLTPYREFFAAWATRKAAAAKGGREKAAMAKLPEAKRRRRPRRK